VPPWEIERGSARWFYRWLAEQTLRAQVEHSEPNAEMDD
jgi:hypothetical protein